jgi:glyoxylase-like metal-dependent hydrolase (beta-lactamase superfamily II)
MHNNGYKENTMKKVSWIICIVILNISTLYARVSSNKGNLFDIKRLSDRAIVLTGFPLPSGCQITALSTERGLVIIDIGGTPRLTKEARHLIEKEFNRSDFAYVILTHDHPDHTNGTSVFPEAVIIAHETCRDILVKRKSFSVKEDSTLNINLNSWKQSITNLQSQLGGLDPNTERAEIVRRSILSYEMAVDDLEKGFKILPPSMGFNDEMTLNLGDVTISLYAFGPYHSDNDIFIHIPEEGILVIGDTFSKRVLPGRDARNMKVRIPLWLEVLDRILVDGTNLKHVIRGHNDIFPGEFIVAAHQYIRGVWEEVNRAHMKGLSLLEIQRICSYNQYAFIGKVMAQDTSKLQNQHENLVEGYWRQLQGKKFAYELLVSWNRELSGFSTPEAKRVCIDRYREMVSHLEDFFFDEPSFIWIARGFIASGECDEAIELLRLHLIPFPESADTHATLGQAYRKNQEVELAVQHLRKALTLNPDHKQAKKILQEMKIKKD